MSFEALQAMPPAMRAAYHAELGKRYAELRLEFVHQKVRQDYSITKTPANVRVAERRLERIMSELLEIEELISLATLPDEHETVDFRDGDPGPIMHEKL